MKGKHLLIAILPVLFGLNSCKTQSAAEASKDSGETITQTTKAADFDSQITGKYWRVTELNGKKITVAVSDVREPHLILKTDGNRLTGHSGCNSFFGGYSLQPGNRITFSQIGSTRIACPNMETESQLFQVLEAVDNYTINGDTLLLNKAKMAPLARLKAVYLK
jgi:heat shock protein HslJ